MDVIAIDMIEPLREGGPLDRISGLDLASGPLTVNPSNADYNLDGIADSDERKYVRDLWTTAYSFSASTSRRIMSRA